MKLTSIHFTHIEHNCSQEKLIEINTEIQPFYEIIFKYIDKFFPKTSLENKREFTFLLNSFINGIYPLLHPTHKQLIALKESVKWYNVPDFKFTLYDGILLLTANLNQIDNYFFIGLIDKL